MRGACRCEQEVWIVYNKEDAISVLTLVAICRPLLACLSNSRDYLLL